MNSYLIEAYTSKWKEDFKNIASEILDACTPLDIKIEHVGSTAVPMLAAKPIIDIDIIYCSKTKFIDIKKALENLNYYHNGDQGIADREVFKRKDNATKDSILDKIAHHLYVCPSDSLELEKHLLFRNYLRTNESARIEYEKLKLDIAKEANQERKNYALIKEQKAKGYIDSIVQLAKAENYL